MQNFYRAVLHPTEDDNKREKATGCHVLYQSKTHRPPTRLKVRIKAKEYEAQAKMRKRWAQWCKAEHMVEDPRKIPFDAEESIATQNLTRAYTQTSRPDTFAAMKEYFSDFDHGS